VDLIATTQQTLDFKQAFGTRLQSEDRVS